MSDNKFVDAYDDLMGHLYELMDDTIHSVSDAMEIAKEKTKEGLSQEEIDRIATFLMRDIEHAAIATESNTAQQSSSSSNSESTLAEWLKFDIELLEGFALDAFISIADKTRVELAKIENQAKKYHPYTQGDIAGPGTFVCDNCGKHIAFKSTSEIPECPSCQTKNFSRS